MTWNDIFEFTEENIDLIVDIVVITINFVIGG